MFKPAINNMLNVFPLVTEGKWRREKASAFGLEKRDRQTLFPAVFPSFGGKKHLQVPDTGLPASNMHFSCPQISDMHLPVHY